jgi:PPM family protein phosphatase
MKRVADRAGATQTGNVRRLNEDSYLIREPLFMVADGMGGAQAGEIASRMTTEEFAQARLVPARGEDTLRDVIVAANAKIHQRASSDSTVAGMGTTVAAALVGDDGRVAFAHVGDSRAYLLRDGALQRLTEDHSLVGELVRQGELTEAEAEQHPQRSVITRALGAEADVRVDTFTVDSQPGDVVLLCSDGLTTMVDEATIGRLLYEHAGAAEAASELVRAALAAGGEDNVTVVIFRIDDLADVEDDEQTPGEHVLPPELWLGGASGDSGSGGDRGEGRHTLRLVFGGLAALAVIAVAVVGAIAGLRWSHFVGADERTGQVAVYQGVPVDLPLGVRLYHETFLSDVPYRSLSAAERQRLFNHRLRSQSSAREAIQPLELP